MLNVVVILHFNIKYSVSAEDIKYTKNLKTFSLNFEAVNRSRDRGTVFKYFIICTFKNNENFPQYIKIKNLFQLFSRVMERCSTFKGLRFFFTIYRTRFYKMYLFLF